jgi:dipeptidyl aminopeptidase/acylaminoacyl peptidase
LPPEARRLLRDQNARAIGYVTVGETWDYHFFDPAREAAWQLIASSLRGRLVSFESATPDFSKLVFYVEGPGHPGNFVLFDASSRSLTQIGRAYPDIAGNEVAQVQAIEYPAADGLMIPAYLTLPLGRQPHDLPLVILAHGGPQARDYGGFEWMAQGLASRGYAVLQPNFRGSGGYGTAFIEAGYGQWGRKMQTDLSDGIAFLASQGIVDPARACIMGASYGGYAALAGVTLQRDVYRCAVAIAPVSDVRDFLAWRAVRSGEDTSTLRYWTRYLGVTDRNDRRLDEISTVRAAGGDDAPVLLIHGRDDTIVPYQQSEAAQRALSAAGRTVELVPLRQEDHYLSREATRVQTLNAAVAFIEQHNPPN